MLLPLRVIAPAPDLINAPELTESTLSKLRVGDEKANTTAPESKTAPVVAPMVELRLREERLNGPAPVAEARVMEDEAKLPTEDTKERASTDAAVLKK